MFEAVVAEVMETTDDELTSRFRELEMLRRRTEAEMAAIVREGERRGIHAADGHRTIRHWVRAHINCSTGEASRLRRLALVCDTLPDVGETLLHGHVGSAQAHELARLAAHPRVGDQFDGIAPTLLGHAEHLSFEEFRTVAKRWETLADLDGAERDDEVSHERRTATVIPTGGGIDICASGGTGLVAAEMAAIFQQFLQAEFDRDVQARTAEFGSDAPASKLPRTDPQRRFDALVQMFRAAAAAGTGAGAPASVVVNLLVGLDSYERLITDRVAGTDPGIGGVVDLEIERMETDTGVRVSPSDVLAASVIGHIRRVVVDSVGVVVDAGRRRRLFTGPAREMALLLRHSCDHLGCTVAADRCEVDHVAEWERDDGATDQANGRPRCGTHNPYKSANGIRSVRTRAGPPVDLRADGTPMAPVGRRIEFDDTAPLDLWDTNDQLDSGDRGDADPVGNGDGTWRTIRVEYCRLRSPELRIQLT